MRDPSYQIRLVEMDKVLKSWDRNQLSPDIDKSTASDPWEWQSLSLVRVQMLILCAETVNCSFFPWCVCSLRLLPYRKPHTEISQTCSLLCLYTRNLPLPVRCLRQTPSFWASPSAPPPEWKVHPNPTFLYVCPSFLHSLSTSVRSSPKLCRSMERLIQEDTQ